MREEFKMEAPGGRTIRGDLYRADGAVNGVVLCHGFKGFARWGPWPLLAQALNERGLNAVAFDFSGSGVGADRENFTDLDAFANNTYRLELEDLNAVVNHSTKQRWTLRDCGLFGHSRGGATAIFFAADSDRVCCLATWASIATIDRWSPEQIRDWEEHGYTEIVNSRTGQVLRLGKSALEECLHESRYRLDVECCAARVRASWLIVHGSADEVVPASDAQVLKQANARGDHGMLAELRMVEGAGHAFGATHPLTKVPAQLQEVIDATADFFGRALTP